MNIQHYHHRHHHHHHHQPEQAQTQTMGLHPVDYSTDQRSLDESSEALEPKAEANSLVDSEDQCPVCGDRVSGYHYGLLTCESCKGFFKRTVQNNKRYTCMENENCPMDPTQRKRCPSCRFQKCLAVGMRREAVRADRMRGGRNKFGPLYRRDRQLKQQRVVHEPNTAPYRIKLESPSAQLASMAHDFHLLPVSSNTSSALHSGPYHLLPPPAHSVNQADFSPVMLDSGRERMQTHTAHTPHSSLYPPSFHRYTPEKGPVGRLAPAAHSTTPPSTYVPQSVNSYFGSPHGSPTPPAFTPSSTPTSTSTPTPTPTLTPTPSSTPSSTPGTQTPTPTNTPTPGPTPPSHSFHAHAIASCSSSSSSSSSACTSSDFLGQLLQGEPDESQLCARVLASLQREQASRGKHDRLNTFSIMCKMADQTLFGLVEWARNSALFKELKVEDQMVLLQSCWSELLVLDHLCRQVAYGKEGCVYLVTGQQIGVSTVFSQAGATLSSLVSRTQDLVSKLRSLQLDRQDFVCLKYLVLFNPDVKSVQDREQVERTQERVNRALMEHTLHAHPAHSDKFGQLLLRLPEVRSISLQVEEYLYQRHLLGDLPCNSLLTEMLHAKHS